MIGYILDRDLRTPSPPPPPLGLGDVNFINNSEKNQGAIGDLQGHSTIVYGPLKVTNVNILNKSC